MEAAESENESSPVGTGRLWAGSRIVSTELYLIANRIIFHMQVLPSGTVKVMWTNGNWVERRQTVGHKWKGRVGRLTVK